MANFILEDLKKTFGDKSNRVAQIIIVNAVIFITVGVLDAILKISGVSISLTKVFSLNSDFWEFISSPWGIFTYMFMHGGFGHIFFNMIILYWMGKILSEYLGAKKFLSTYILGGLFAGLLYLSVYTLFHGLFPENIYFLESHLIGASGAVLAVAFAAATLLPEYEIKLLLIGSVKLKYIAVALLIIEVLLDLNENFGGKIAHLGGAIYGYLYISQLRKGKDLAKSFDYIAQKVPNPFKKKSPLKVAHKKERSQQSSRKTDSEWNVERKSDQEVVDGILDKINKSGYPSLTDQEKAFLFNYSKKKK